MAKVCVVPVEATEEMWLGLARDMMMWLDMSGRPTPRKLFDHLENLGREIPQWLRDEPEMQALDHVPSKGARVAIIYKAMLAARPTEGDAALRAVVGAAAAVVANAGVGSSGRAGDYAVRVNAELWRNFIDALARARAAGMVEKGQ